MTLTILLIISFILSGLYEVIFGTIIHALTTQSHAFPRLYEVFFELNFEITVFLVIITFPRLYEVFFELNFKAKDKDAFIVNINNIYNS